MTEEKNGPRFLRKVSDGYVYPYTETLAKRGDMIACDKAGNRIDVALPEGIAKLNTTEMEISGKKYDVPEYLVETVETLIVDASGRESSILEAEIVKLKDDIAKALQDKNGLAKEKIALASSVSDLQEKYSGLLSDVKKLEAEKSTLADDIAVLEKENKKLEAEIKKLKK